MVTDRLASEIKPVLSLASVLGTVIMLETVEVASRLADTAEAAFAFVARLTGIAVCTPVAAVNLVLAGLR